jgi:hypothetical protein
MIVCWLDTIYEKTAKTSLFDKDRDSENRNCVTQGEDAFDLKICYEQDEDGT